MAGFLAPVFAAAAVGTAFLPAFLVTRGLDAAEIGVLLAVGTVVRMLAAVQGMGAAPLMPLADAVSLGLAGQGRLDYGRVRGSASAVFTAATAGAMAFR
jgi:hypothetical protein